jgi:hypothetical protein
MTALNAMVTNALRAKTNVLDPAVHLVISTNVRTLISVQRTRPAKIFLLALNVTEMTNLNARATNVLRAKTNVLEPAVHFPKKIFAMPIVPPTISVTKPRQKGQPALGTDVKVTSVPETTVYSSNAEEMTAPSLMTRTNATHHGRMVMVRLVPSGQLV